MRYEIVIACVICSVGFALWKGAGPERMGAGVLLGMYVLDPLYHLLVPHAGHYRHVDPGHFAIDAMAMAAWLAIALKADRTWTLWAAAAQLLALMSHLLRAIDSSWDGLAYALLIRAPSYIQILCLMIGTWLEMKRKRAGNASGPWLSSSRRSPGGSEVTRSQPR